MTLLDRYIAATVFRSYVLVAATLTGLFSLLEFVEQLGFVGQGHYRLIDAFVYTLLTAPYRLLQVTPVSMLMGCLLSMGNLAKNSELTALRSLGASEYRIVGAVVRLTVPILIALFLLAQFVIPPAQQLAQQRRSAALSSSVLNRSEDSFWAHGDHQFLNVQEFEFGNVPKNIDIYAFDQEGKLTSFTHADQADIKTDGTWLLTGVLRKYIDSSQFNTEHLDSLAWHSFLSPRETQLLILPPESLPPIALYQYVRNLKLRHQQAIRYEEELWTRVSIPFSMIAMIMIAAPFAFGPPRAQNTGLQIVIGTAFGVVFTLGQQIAGHLDLLLDLNPAATALGPSLIMMGLAAYLFLRLHR